MDPDWVDVFPIENGDIPAIAMLVCQRVSWWLWRFFFEAPGPFVKWACPPSCEYLLVFFVDEIRLPPRIPSFVACVEHRVMEVYYSDAFWSRSAEHCSGHRVRGSEMEGFMEVLHHGRDDDVDVVDLSSGYLHFAKIIANMIGLNSPSWKFVSWLEEENAQKTNCIAPERILNVWKTILSFWNGSFLGNMLNFGVYLKTHILTWVVSNGPWKTQL